MSELSSGHADDTAEIFTDFASLVRAQVYYERSSLIDPRLNGGFISRLGTYLVRSSFRGFPAATIIFAEHLSDMPDGTYESETSLRLHTPLVRCTEIGTTINSDRVCRISLKNGVFIVSGDRLYRQPEESTLAYVEDVLEATYDLISSNQLMACTPPSIS